MTAYLIPTDDAMVEKVAKSIAKNRLHTDAKASLSSVINVEAIDDRLDATIDRIFDALWSGTTDHDELQRENYRSDALAAIGTINLVLITSTS